MSTLALPFGQVLSATELLDPAAREQHRWVRLIEIYVAECVSAQTVPRASELAHRLGCAPAHLSRVFRRATGVKLATALQHEQARRAAELLVRTPLGAVRIGEVTGFGSPKAFYRTFTRVYGMTPSAYRQERRKRMEELLRTRSSEAQRTQTNVREVHE